MLTLNKLKTFLNINADNTSKDEFLKQCIAGAVKEINGMVNRRLDYDFHSEVINGSGTKFAYLKNYPVTTVTGLFLIGNDGFEEIIKLPDLIDKSLMIFDAGFIFLRKSYFFPAGDMNILVDYNSGYMDADNWKAGNKYEISDTVNFDDNIYECNTEHIAGSEFNDSFWTRLDAKASPADLQKAVKYLAARQFYESAAGKNLFAVKAESSGGLASRGIAYKEIEIEHIINSYRKPNI